MVRQPIKFYWIKHEMFNYWELFCNSMCVVCVMLIRLTIYWPFFFHSEVCSFNAVFGKASFQANVSSTLYVSPMSFGHLSFGLMSFRQNVFCPYAHSAVCPFGQISLDWKLFPSYVFRQNVRSVICLSAICFILPNISLAGNHCGHTKFGTEDPFK